MIRPSQLDRFRVLRGDRFYGAVVATVVAALLFGSREEEQDTKEAISPIVAGSVLVLMPGS